MEFMRSEGAIGALVITIADAPRSADISAADTIVVAVNIQCADVWLVIHTHWLLNTHVHYQRG